MLFFSLKCNTHTLHAHVLGAQLGGFLKVNTSLPTGRRAAQNTTRSRRASVTPPSLPPQVNRARQHHGAQSLSAHTSECASVPSPPARSAQRQPLRLLRTEVRGAAAGLVPCRRSFCSCVTNVCVVPGCACGWATCIAQHPSFGRGIHTLLLDAHLGQGMTVQSLRTLSVFQVGYHIVI